MFRPLRVDDDMVGRVSDPVALTGVEETLIIPLWARAMATRAQGLIDDPVAVELVDRLDYDFESKLGHAKHLASFSLVRTARFDEAVRDFIATNPDGAVVELGCGLDTRWERCAGHRIDWFDLDLHTVIALRRQYFEDGPRRTMIAAPLQDSTWHDLVGPTDRPFMFVAEGVMLYLDPDDVTNSIRSLSESFPASAILLDTISTGVMKRQHNHPLTRHYDAAFKWAVDDIATLTADNGYNVSNAEYLADLRHDERKRISLTPRVLLMVMRTMRWFRESSRIVKLSSSP